MPGYGHLVRNPGILNYQATFETAAEHWKQEIRYTIKDSTFSNYEAILKNQLLPELGSTRIRKISNSQITQLIHKKKELTLSAGTIHVILSVLRSILNFAAKGGVYTSEPIRYPHLAGTSQEVQIMKLANYNQLEKFLIDNISDFHFGLLLCMHTGIRVGELSGLRWEDVDFAQHKIRIQRTVIRIKNLDQTANPDTEKIPKNHSVYRSAEDRTFQQGNSVARQAAVLCETFS